MGKDNGAGMVPFGLVTSIPEHYTLIARPLLVGFLAYRRSGVNPLTDIPRLGGQLIGHKNMIGMKTSSSLTYPISGLLPGQSFRNRTLRPSKSAGNRHAIALNEGFARDRLWGSCSRQASSTLSEIVSDTLSGCPSPTDLKKNE